MDQLELLRTNALFANIPEKEYTEILNLLAAHEVFYGKDATIFQEKDQVLELGIVMEGSVSLLRDDYLGFRTIIANLQPGSILAEALVCAGMKEALVSAVSTVPTKILWLDFPGMLKRRPHLLLIQNMMKILANKNLFLNERLRHISKRTIREKIYAFLISVSRAKKANGKPFSIDMNRNDMSDYLAVDRAALSRELAKMQKEKIIEYHKDTFKIINRLP